MVCRVGLHVFCLSLLLSTLVLAPAARAQQAVAAPQKADEAPAIHPGSGESAFVTVNGKIITQNEFQLAFANFLRAKFYHGQVPQDQIVAARKEVADQLINRILYQEEIARRNIEPDAEDVEKRVMSYDQRYANSPAWIKNRETMLPGLREQLGQQSRMTRLEQSVKAIAAPTPEEAKDFYKAKPDLFTEPEKLHLHSILLAVDPSSPRAAWDAALREGEGIVRRLRAGASFADQARLFSKDASAENGGDMGYLHLGMLPDSLQSKIDQYKIGEVAEPIEMLQGIGIFRLDERVAAKLQPFDAVATRASELLRRERQEAAWANLISKLRADAKIVYSEDLSKAPELRSGK